MVDIRVTGSCCRLACDWTPVYGLVKKLTLRLDHWYMYQHINIQLFNSHVANSYDGICKQSISIYVLTTTSHGQVGCQPPALRNDARG
jgi:hypothetical protein